MEATIERATAWVMKSAFSRFLDQVVNNGELDIVGSIFHPAFNGRMPESDIPYLGPSGARRWAKGLRTGFSELNSFIEGGWLIAEDDTHHVGRGAIAQRVAAYVVFRGVHTGPYLGMAPTGCRVTFSQVHLLRYESGLIADDVVISDRLTLLQQLKDIDLPPGVAGPHLPTELI